MTTPLTPRLRDAIAHVADRLVDVPWLVVGSTARALLGFATDPRDLDIEVAAVDVDRAAAALDLGVEDCADDRARSRRARGAAGGVEIDLTAGLTLVGPGGILPPDFELMRRFATSVDVDGRSIAVAPLEEQIVRILVSGNEERRARFVGEAPDAWAARGDYVELRLAAARAAR